MMGKTVGNNYRQYLRASEIRNECITASIHEFSKLLFFCLLNGVHTVRFMNFFEKWLLGRDLMLLALACYSKINGG